MSEAENAFPITPPHAEQAEQLIRLRARLYVDELVLCGVDRAVALRHTAPWLTPEGIAEYQSIVANWLQNPQKFVRTVHAPALGQGAVGLFVADIAGGQESQEAHYVHSIQLDHPVRRLGIGRRLFHEFAATAGTEQPIELDVYEKNRPARRFYTRLGFVSLHHYEQTVIGHLAGEEPGTQITSVRLRRAPTSIGL